MSVRILIGDVRDKLRELPDESVHCAITSPPYYGLRDYGTAQWDGGDVDCDHAPPDEWVRQSFNNNSNLTGISGQAAAGRARWFMPDGSCRCGARRIDHQIGLEPSPDEYVAALVSVFRDVRRVLRRDGTLWLNIGDSYAATTKGSGGHNPKQDSNAGSWMADRRWQIPCGLKAKDLIGIPWMLAFALRADGWWLRQDIIWSKPNPMPESVQGSHFSRHMVTIPDYERLSGLRYVDERAGNDWAGDMPSLSEVEVPHSKAPLSAERQGDCDGAGARGTSGRSGEAAPLCSIGAGAGEPKEILPNAEGQRGREAKVGGVSRSPAERGRCSDGGRLDRDFGAAQTPLLLLQEADAADDAGSRRAAEQGRPELARKRGSSVPLVQQQEAGQDDHDRLVGCPGCDKCCLHHGYTFHMSAGRCTKAHEYLFLLSKSERYYFDADAIKEQSITGDPRRPYTSEGAWALDGRPAEQRHGGESRLAPKAEAPPRHDGERWNENGGRGFKPRTAGNKSHKYVDAYEASDTEEHRTKAGLMKVAEVPWHSRNRRSVWTIATAPYSEAHFATFPPALVEPWILAGSPKGGTILDPFGGAGTTGLVADRLGRDAILIELNPEYADMAKRRIEGDAPLFADIAYGHRDMAAE